MLPTCSAEGAAMPDDLPPNLVDLTGIAAGRKQKAKANGYDAGNGNSRIVSGRDFVASYSPPDWLIDGIVQSGRLYACTSLTGHGKTAVWLYNACMIQAARKVAHLETEPGNVLYLAGENPEDLKARMLGMMQAFNLTLNQLPYVLP